MVISKRGVSAVIASVLLILLVLVLSSLIFSWARDFVNDKNGENDASAAQLCPAVDFDVITIDRTGSVYDFEAVNRGNVNISSLRFMVFSGGTSAAVDYDVEFLSGAFISDSIDLGVVADKVDVFAVLDGGGSSEIVCDDDSVHLKGV